jgi:hypothetical protein
MKVPRLLASELHGEGDLKMPENWTEHHWLLRADILKDWIGMLERHYDSALIEGKAESAIIKAKVKAYKT